MELLGRELTMDFSFTDEQSMLRDSVAPYLADNYDFDTARRDRLAGRLAPRGVEGLRQRPRHPRRAPSPKTSAAWAATPPT